MLERCMAPRDIRRRDDTCSSLAHLSVDGAVVVVPEREDARDNPSRRKEPIESDIAPPALHRKKFPLRRGRQSAAATRAPALVEVAHLCIAQRFLRNSPL